MFHDAVALKKLRRRMLAPDQAREPLELAAPADLIARIEASLKDRRRVQ